jgi:hypothetical protein
MWLCRLELLVFSSPRESSLSLSLVRARSLSLSGVRSHPQTAHIITHGHYHTHTHTHIPFSKLCLLTRNPKHSVSCLTHSRTITMDSAGLSSHLDSFERSFAAPSYHPLAHARARASSTNPSVTPVYTARSILQSYSLIDGPQPSGGATSLDQSTIFPLLLS